MPGEIRFSTPQINTLEPLMSILTNESLSFDISAYSEVGNELRLSMDSPNLPSSAQFTDHGNGRGTFSWKPNNADAGSYSDIIFTVFDGNTTNSTSTTIDVSRANLLLNAGFENGKISGWRGHASIDVYKSNYFNHSGDYSLEITGDPNSYRHIQQRYSHIIEGHQYQFSGWVMVVSNTNGVGKYYFKVRWLDSSGATIPNTTEKFGFTGNPDYVEKPINLIAPPNAASAIFVAQASRADGRGYFDDFTITDITGGSFIPDTRAPSIPQNLSATVVSTHQIQLNWAPSTDTESGVAGYHVYRNYDSYADNIPIATVTTGTNYTDTNVLPNTMYRYTVSAFDNNNIPNESTFPNSIHVTSQPINDPGNSNLVKNINMDNYDRVKNLTKLGNKVYFSANDGIHGQELWVSDGSMESTKLVKDINPGIEGSLPKSFFPYNNKLYFVALSKLWETDGTNAGTLSIDSMPEILDDFHIFNNAFYFSCASSLTGYELCKSDITTPESQIIRDIHEGEKSSTPQDFITFGGALYFTAYHDAIGRALWKTDGTGTGTVLVKKIVHDPHLPFLSSLIKNEIFIFLLLGQTTIGVLLITIQITGKVV